MVSVFASAVTIWLCYLIGIMLIRSYRRSTEQSISDAILVYGSAAVGALAFCWSDTFWFNAVESEVYASSSLFVALIVYVMMRWNEEADKAGHERYLIMIAYLIGLSTGVHLLSVLTIFSLGLVIYFRKYPLNWKTFILMGAITLVAFAVVYPGVVKMYPALLSGNLPFKNEAHEYYVENQGWVHMLAIVILIGLVLGVVMGYKRKRPVLTLACASFVSLFLGYTTYTQTLIRANASPPMNENAPKSFNALISYLGREQYGDDPMFPRRFERDADKMEAYKKYGPYTPPPNKHIPSIREPGMSFTVPDYSAAKMNSGDWNYLFQYQLDHMFWRYLLWNFFGRTSDVQDADAYTWVTSAKYVETQNEGNGYAQHFPVTFYGIPFVIGILGLILHFRRDPKMAVVYMAMFLVMGAVAAFAQNQQEPQPRERDYFYTGAFMVWALWIAIGSYMLLDEMRQRVKVTAVQGFGVAVLVAVVPVNMAWHGWFIHSRAGNYLPFDLSYNILQSCRQDAILVTNGDNDTFPLWLLQDVYGIRRDIRIVNMSLASTLWYVYDLKHLEPWGAKTLPLTFDDKNLLTDEYSDQALRTDFGPAKDVQFQLSDTVRRQFGLSSNSSQSTFHAKLTGYSRSGGQYAFTVSQQVIIDFLKQTKFERPLYYSITCGYPTSDIYCGLGGYTRLEGMAYQVCPMQTGESGEVVDFATTEKCLMHVRNGDDWDSGPSYGFKLRNLNNMSVYYDETHRHYVDNYRTMYIRYANALYNAGEKAHAVAVLDTMNAMISMDQFQESYALMQDIADIYTQCGADTQANAIERRVADQCERLVEKPYLQKRYPQFVDRIPPAITASQAYTKLGEFSKARAMLETYRNTSGDKSGTELRLAKLDADEKEAKGDVKGALELVQAYAKTMRERNQPQYRDAIIAFENKAIELQQRLSATTAH